MARRIIIGLVAAVAVASFAGSSRARPHAESPVLRNNLAAAHLSPVALSADVSSAIDAAIGPRFGGRFGITYASYAVARRLARTAAGDLYLIPGTSGACLAMLSGVAVAGISCGDPGSAGAPLLALLVQPLAGGDFIGGGVASNAVSSVLIGSGRGAPAVKPTRRFSVSGGVFLVSPAAGITPTQHPTFTAVQPTTYRKSAIHSMVAPDAAHQVLTTNCTHYSYPYSENYNCYLYATISPASPETTGFAKRTSNEISFDNTSRDWEVWYNASDGVSYLCCAVSGSSAGGSTGSSQDQYAYALCWIGGSTSVPVYCETSW